MNISSLSRPCGRLEYPKIDSGFVLLQTVTVYTDNSNNIYKLINKNERFHAYLSPKYLFSEEHKGCLQNTDRYREPLLTSQMVHGDCKTNKKDFSTAWIDCKKVLGKRRVLLIILSWAYLGYKGKIINLCHKLLITKEACVWVLGQVPIDSAWQKI